MDTDECIFECNDGNNNLLSASLSNSGVGDLEIVL